MAERTRNAIPPGPAIAGGSPLGPCRASGSGTWRLASVGQEGWSKGRSVQVLLDIFGCFLVLGVLSFLFLGWSVSLWYFLVLVGLYRSFFS